MDPFIRIWRESATVVDFTLQSEFRDTELIKTTKTISRALIES